LLDHAHIGPPYVLVGHSYGGLLVRLFADVHPNETSGVVLVESMGQNQDRRFLPIWQAQPPHVRRALPKPGANPVEDGVDLRASQALAAKVSTLGDTPLAVITRGRPDDGGPPLPPSVRRLVARLWVAMQTNRPRSRATMCTSSRCAAIASSNGWTSGNRTSSSAPCEPSCTPPAPARALPPCRRVFSGSGVRCRS
jgi:pimeloyl-ACP methyl ester carboxylesterase